MLPRVAARSTSSHTKCRRRSPTTVADEFLAGPLESCQREVAGEPHDPEAVDGSGGA